jgi:multidrug efflux pump subunit AcrB
VSAWLRSDDPQHSFQRLFLVLSVAPLGLIGVVSALFLSGKPLGFVAIVGVISLIGLDVRNSVILMAQIDAEVAQGRDTWDAVIEATVHRLRPILLTASAAPLGMIPIATTVFWSPFAFAVTGRVIGRDIAHSCGDRGHTDMDAIAANQTQAEPALSHRIIAAAA